MKTDIVLGLQYGDEGKGKVTHSLLRNGNYTHCLRFNGGCNAGHTIYHNGEKMVTHHIPAGVFFGVKSVIGSGCVIDPVKLFQEIETLEAAGVDVHSNLLIAYNAHIITSAHKEADGTDTRIGTTRTGNGPAYSDKHARTGKRACDVPELENYICDLTEVFDDRSVVIAEGAQGFWLDIDYGNYPYVTSSACGVSAVIQNGIPYSTIRSVYGVIKGYETYVGALAFQTADPAFPELQRVGAEFGATTGRVRQCNWIDEQKLRTAIRLNDVTDLIVNKMDVMQDVGVWKTREKTFNTENEFKRRIYQIAPSCSVKFSYSPMDI